MVLQAIRYTRGKLEILDQLRLPHEEVYIELRTPQDAWDAIYKMQTRGAPAIAMVAALSLAVSLPLYQDDRAAERGSWPDAVAPDFISHTLKYLVTSRPTAVNLADAARKLERVAYAADALPGATRFSVNEAYIQAAEKMLVHDVHDNENIGAHGADWIVRHSTIPSPRGKLSVLTHCNTGSLATAGYGTALGVVRSLHARGLLNRAYYTETRPYNQGSRLTGYELIHDGIPATLITDSMAAALLNVKREPENIACIVVGADRVAANGDTANKIGTYSLAILARFHNVKFLVAAPRTTVDLSTASGAEIVIEERSPTEVITLKGPLIQRNKARSMSIDSRSIEEISTAAKMTTAWNPAFDVTPANLIDGVVTEKGVVEKDKDGAFHFDSIFKADVSDYENARHSGISDSQPIMIPDGKISWKAALNLKPGETPSWIAWMKA